MKGERGQGCVGGRGNDGGAEEKGREGRELRGHTDIALPNIVQNRSIGKNSSLGL